MLTVILIVLTSLTQNELVDNARKYKLRMTILESLRIAYCRRDSIPSKVLMSTGKNLEALTDTARGKDARIGR